MVDLRAALTDEASVREVWRRCTTAAARVVARDPSMVRRARRRGVSDVWLRWARHVAVWLTREITGASYPMIGRVVDRDHTTVRHDCLKVAHALGRGIGPVRAIAAGTLGHLSAGVAPARAATAQA